MSIALLNGADIGRWITHPQLDRPKQIIRLIHGEGFTTVEWFRDPEKRDAKSALKARPESKVTVYLTCPTTPDRTTP